MSLTHYKTKSCGCLQRERASEANKGKERGRLGLVGEKFGRLFVLKDVGTNKWRNSQVLCLCDCGNKVIVLGNSLKNGNTESCGCLQKEVARETVIKRNKSGKHSPNYRHGQSKTLTYKCEKAMRHKALKKNQTPKNADSEKIAYIYQICRLLNSIGDEKYVVDHIKPLNKGGLHHQDNLQILLENINGEKSDKWPLTEEEKIGFRL